MGYGDFCEVQSEDEKKAETAGEILKIPFRIKIPRENQLVGIIVEKLGGNYMLVKIKDDKTLRCRIPGRFKRKFWLKQGDVVIVELWQFSNDKADIVYQYKINEISHLRKYGFLDGLDKNLLIRSANVY